MKLDRDRSVGDGQDWIRQSLAFVFWRALLQLDPRCQQYFIGKIAQRPGVQRLRIAAQDQLDMFPAFMRIAFLPGIRQLDTVYVPRPTTSGCNKSNRQIGRPLITASENSVPHCINP